MQEIKYEKLKIFSKSDYFVKNSRNSVNYVRRSKKTSLERKSFALSDGVHMFLIQLPETMLFGN